MHYLYPGIRLAIGLNVPMHIFSFRLFAVGMGMLIHLLFFALALSSRANSEAEFELAYPLAAWAIAFALMALAVVLDVRHSTNSVT